MDSGALWWTGGFEPTPPVRIRTSALHVSYGPVVGMEWTARSATRRAPTPGRSWSAVGVCRSPDR